MFITHVVFFVLLILFKIADDSRGFNFEYTSSYDAIRPSQNRMCPSK